MKRELDSTFLARLNELFVGPSSESVIQRLGIKRRELDQYLAGEKSPTLEFLCRLVWSGVDLRYLLTGIGKPRARPPKEGQLDLTQQEWKQLEKFVLTLAKLPASEIQNWMNAISAVLMRKM